MSSFDAWRAEDDPLTRLSKASGALTMFLRSIFLVLMTGGFLAFSTL